MSFRYRFPLIVFSHSLNFSDSMKEGVGKHMRELQQAQQQLQLGWSCYSRQYTYFMIIDGPFVLFLETITQLKINPLPLPQHFPRKLTVVSTCCPQNVKHEQLIHSLIVL